ncbi:meprin A subunit alpha-like [Alligator sinensis]|uniref:Metalloendopeptidase n=1 Tax=Alligator sinensis TaxID=38654 RepID=A0A1U7SGM1_ALLSI|nr:meprin A subunit alpha-like [Alligator sinensis]
MKGSEGLLIFSQDAVIVSIVAQSPVYDIDERQLRSNIPEINAATRRRLFEGDIILSPERNALRNSSYRWKFPIPYILADSLDLNAKGVILQAFEMFRLKTCVDFKPYEGEKTYLKFEKLDGCWSYVGDLQTGQTVSIGDRCDYKYLVEHEVLHALGFYHEQSRTDRDDYVQIWWDQITEGYAYAFDKHNDSYLLDLNTPYDYESVLHYGPYSFNIHSNISSITTKIPKFNEIIGQRLDLSRIDSLELNKLYGCSSSLTLLDQCTFENINICGMVQGEQDDADWGHTLGKPGNEDHTLLGHCKDGGYFMHLDTRTGNASQSALLESRVFYPKRKEKCLQFFYKLNGSPQDKLVIWVKMDDGTGNVRKMVKLHTIQADGKHHWKLSNIPFNVQTKFRYAFQGIKGDPASSSGGITIDDISLTETKCPTSVWHIRNFTTLFNSTSRGDFISSPVFYSSEGYGFELRLYPHGRATSSYVNYMGITFHLCSSENDGLLEWPAGNRQAILTVLDQDPEVAQRMSLSLSFTTNPNQRVYEKNDTLQWDKPSITGNFSSSCNCYVGPGAGWNSFLTHREMHWKNFLKNDDLFIFADFEGIVS